MVISFNELLYALSYALDCVEGELLGVTTNHAKRVAYVCVKMGKHLSMSEPELNDLAACAVLHDNALTQYVAEERKETIDDISLAGSLGVHCILGQQNVEKFPFFGDVTGVILYHHENEDGSGPFGRRGSEIPLNARLIHLADILDLSCNLGQVYEDKLQKVHTFLENWEGKFFSSEDVKLFCESMSDEEILSIAKEPIDEQLYAVIPKVMKDYPSNVLKEMTTVFAHVIDYKSEFTSRHSIGIAEKAATMGGFYKYDAVTVNKLYIAGALHDIGKLAISNDVLEKPDKLTDDEYAYMKNHAWYTWKILSHIEGMEDIAHWAALHHEKLNGKGYPFGKTAKELDKNDRLMGCIDIYQALTEERPYKAGMTHEASIGILSNMAKEGFIDGDIVKDIDKVFKTKEESLCQN